MEILVLLALAAAIWWIFLSPGRKPPPSAPSTWHYVDSSTSSAGRPPDRVPARVPAPPPAPSAPAASPSARTGVPSASGDASWSGPNGMGSIGAILADAVAQGRDVQFMYRKPRDARPILRRVTPYGFKRVAHVWDDGDTLCLEGFCHLRQADRVFALKRMRDVRMI